MPLISSNWTKPPLEESMSLNPWTRWGLFAHHGAPVPTLIIVSPSILLQASWVAEPNELHVVAVRELSKSHVTFATTDNYDDWCADISEMKNTSIIQAGLLHVTEFVLARPGWLTLLSTTGSSACLPQTIDLGTTFHGICNALADFLTLAVFHGDSQIIEASIPTFVQI